MSWLNLMKMLLMYRRSMESIVLLLKRRLFILKDIYANWEKIKEYLKLNWKYIKSIRRKNK